MATREYRVVKKPIIVIAARLRTAREAAQMTQTELAKKASLKPDHVKKIELGHDNLTMPAFLRWCAALKVKPGQILADLEAE